MFMFSAVDCGNPQPLQNGSIVGNKTVYPNSVTHRCDEGFILHGSSRITCQTNGTWSKTSSYCEGKFYQLNPKQAQISSLFLAACGCNQDIVVYIRVDKFILLWMCG